MDKWAKSFLDLTSDPSGNELLKHRLTEIADKMAKTADMLEEQARNIRNEAVLLHIIIGGLNDYNTDSFS